MVSSRQRLLYAGREGGSRSGRASGGGKGRRGHPSGKARAARCSTATRAARNTAAMVSFVLISDELKKTINDIVDKASWQAGEGDQGAGVAAAR